MQHSKKQNCLFFTKTASKIKAKAYMVVKGVAFILFILQMTVISKANADILQDAIKQSEQLSPALLFDRDALLFNKQNINSVKLSPNGRHILFLVKEGTKQQLWSHNIDKGTTNKLFSSSLINSIYWTQDSESIFLHLKTGVAIVDVILGSKPSIILNLDRKKQQFFYGTDHGSPHHFFVWQKELNTDKRHKKFVLYRVNRQGKKQELYSADKIVKNFIAPSGGAIRFIMENKGLTNKIYDLDKGKKKEIYSCYYTDYCDLVSYQASKNILYLKGRGTGDLIKLLALNLADNSGSKLQVIHQDPEQRFDLDDVVFDVISGKPIMISYQTDFYENYGLTKIASQHIEKIKLAINSPVFRLVPSVNNKHWVVVDANPRKAQKSIYLYDPVSGKLNQPLKTFISALQSENTQLNDEDLALRIAIQYQASDGMVLQGYLTLPRGLEVSTIPLVVNVHGGPFNRSTGDITKVAQFLANRGYGVFEPNFRASEGFGRKYMLAANRDFGNGRVQLDINEGVEYILSRGIGDKNRLAIMGASFGGFSTLTGLTFTPELYQVGFAIAPGTVLSKTAEFFIKQVKAEDKLNMAKVFADRMVDINDLVDLKRSNDKSPYFHMNKLSKPLYILAGERDKKVSILNVRNYALQLEAMGKNVTLISAPKEGHAFRHPTAVEALFYILEKALHTHIGGKIQKELSPKAMRFLKKNTVISSKNVINKNQGEHHVSVI